MKSQANFQNILNEKFMELKAKNHRFSLRAYARKLDMPAASLCGILTGKRRVSRAMAEKIAARLALGPKETVLFMLDFPLSSERQQAEAPKTLSDEQFKLIADWVHFAVLSLMRTEDFFSDPTWIARRLDVDEPRVRDCLARLEAMGLITIEPEGDIKRIYSSVTTTDGIEASSVQASHLQDLEMARSKLKTTDVSERDYSSINIPLDPDLLPVIKKMIREFQDKVFELVKEKRPREVYKLNTYLYPITRSVDVPGVLQ